MLSRDTTQVVLEYLDNSELFGVRLVSNRWYIICKRFIRSRNVSYCAALRYPDDAYRSHPKDAPIGYNAYLCYETTITYTFEPRSIWNVIVPSYSGDFIHSYTIGVSATVALQINDLKVYTKTLEPGTHPIYDYPLYNVLDVHVSRLLCFDVLHGPIKRFEISFISIHLINHDSD
jgi:hypothetical protein